MSTNGALNHSEVLGRGRSGYSTHPQTVSVHELCPDLLSRIGPDQRRYVQEALKVPCLTLPPGIWNPSDISDASGWGILIVDGRIGVGIKVGRRRHLEIIGPGDVGQPWIDDGLSTLAPSTQWRVLQEAQLAILDRRFALGAGRFPAITRELMERLVLRSKRLLFQLAVHSVPQIALRIELLMWHFADRWGRVTRDGVLLELPISHELLAQVTGSQRPSVTTALGDLRRRGRLDRRADGVWLLPATPPRELIQQDIPAMSDVFAER